jgi:formylglycine-generating enzyme required for sulfatase activity
MAKKTVRKIAHKQPPAPSTAKMPEKTATEREHLTPSSGSSSLAASSGMSVPRLGKPEITRVQGLLKSKTADSVTQGLSLLESLGATTGDYAAVFTETVIKAVLNSWIAESWSAVAKVLVPHKTTSELFQNMAEEAFLNRPQKQSDFNGLLLAHLPVARNAFLAAWKDSAIQSQPLIDLVSIPAGSFMMGSPADDRSRLEGEEEVLVLITNPFHISRTVITQGQWGAVMGREPHCNYVTGAFARNRSWLTPRPDQCGDDFPAVYVSWDDAVLFCDVLTSLEREVGRLTPSQAYRLPTEAEWEYACRAGTTTTYSFGDDPALLTEYGWYCDNAKRKIHPVAQKKPSPWGLFDMHGNVNEWCADWYDDTLAGGPDPAGPILNQSRAVLVSWAATRVVRGGHCEERAPWCRSASRGRKDPWGHYGATGFRVVCAG